MLSDVDGLPHEGQVKERFPLFMHNVAEPFAAVVPSIDKILEAEPNGHHCEAETRDRGKYERHDGRDFRLYRRQWAQLDLPEARKSGLPASRNA